ncbi:MAG: glycosyltransferase [Planctomycetota bacterium]
MESPTLTRGIPQQEAHVLHVYASLNRGGAETWLMDIVRHADRNRLKIDVCLIGDAVGPYEQEFKELGGQILRCPLGRNALKFYQRFRDMLREHHYEAVHSHVYLFSGVVLRAAHVAGVQQRIAHIHPIEDFKSSRALRKLYTGWMRSWIVRYGTHFVAPTIEGLEKFWGPNWAADGNKSPVYNGISAQRFSGTIDRAAVREELDLPAEARIALNVSRFAPHKRQAFLVEVAEQVVKKTRDIYFVLVGAGDLRDEVMAQVSQRKLDDRFRFVAGAPNIDKFWMSADAFAFPSCNEGFGIVVAEAAAAGLPVVAQDIPGVRDAARACHDVKLLPLDAGPQAWAEFLLAAIERGPLNDEERRARLADFPFTIERSVAALEKLYDVIRPG